MPEISRFFGVVIRMFPEAGVRHHRARFHARFQDQEAVFGIREIERIGGNLPLGKERLVLAWAEIHQEELTACWEALREGRPPSKIEPLR